MRPAIAELASIAPSIADRANGRSLQVPNGEGGWQSVRTATLRRSLTEPRGRTVVNVSDYGVGDMAFAEVNDRLRAIDSRGKIRDIQDVPIDPFATIATGVVIEQVGVHGENTANTIIFSNTAPRGKDALGDIEWEGEEGKTDQRFVFGVLDSGASVLAVDTGHTLSFVKDSLRGLWVANVSNEGTQFRSRDTYPEALRILQGRRGRDLIGEEIDIKTIAEPPAIEHVDGGISVPVAYIDQYRNIKTTAIVEDVPDELRESGTLLVTVQHQTPDGIHAVTREVANKLAGADVATGDLFFAQGSSGGRRRKLEVNQMFGRSADVFGLPRATDDARVIIQAA